MALPVRLVAAVARWGQMQPDGLYPSLPRGQQL